MKEEKKNKIAKVILIVFFIGYFCLYLVDKSGYYSGTLRKKIELTNEQIAQFENDIEAGKDVSISEYLDTQNKDYSNKFSRLGYSVSTNIESIISNGIGYITSIIKSFVT